MIVCPFSSGDSKIYSNALHLLLISVTMATPEPSLNTWDTK